MKNSLLTIHSFLILLFISIASYAENMSNTIELGNITFVSVTGIGDLYITQGDKNSITVEANSQNELDSVSVSQEGNSLTLNCEHSGDQTLFDKFIGLLSFKHNSNITYLLTLKTLDRLNINGVGNVSIDSLKTNKLTIINNGVGNLTSNELKVLNLNVVNNGVGHVILNFSDLAIMKQASFDLSGVGDFEINQLHVGALQLAMNGVGNVSINGKAKIQALILNSVATYNSSSFFAEQTDLTKNNVGFASINTGKLVVNMNGLGSVDVYGSPKIDIKHKSGMGKINVL